MHEQTLTYLIAAVFRLLTALFLQRVKEIPILADRLSTEAHTLELDNKYIDRVNTKKRLISAIGRTR